MKPIHLLLVLSLFFWACSPLPQPEPQPDLRTVQPQLSAYETAEGLHMQWGWFVWEEEDGLSSGRVVPQRFSILVSEGQRGNWEEVAEVSGVETAFLLDEITASQAYFLAVQAQAENAQPSRSNVVMVVPGGEAELSVLVPEDGKDRKWGTWGFNDQWITYTREVENQLQLYRFQMETRAETFVRGGYSPSSAREIDRTVFLLEEAALDGEAVLGPSLVSTSENGVKVLIEGSTPISHPSISPRGDQVIFLGRTDEIGWGLWHLNLAENERNLLLGSVELPSPSLGKIDRTAHQPSWFPDGERIAYDRFTDKGGWVVKDLYELPAAGGVEEILLRSEWNDFSPAIHPSRNEVAFLSDRSGKLAIWSFDLASEELRQWTGDLDLRIDPKTRLAWNQAGTQLLFTALTEEGGHRLMLATP